MATEKAQRFNDMYLREGGGDGGRGGEGGGGGDDRGKPISFRVPVPDPQS